MRKLIRTSTVPMSLDKLLSGQLRFLNEYYNTLAVSSDINSLNKVAVKEGIDVAEVNMSRQISLIKDLKALWNLFRLFKKEKPLIVHSITPKAGLLSMLAAKFSGVPIRIHTFTGLVFPTKTGLFKRLLIAADWLLCRCATNVYPEGIGVMNDLISYKITSKPLKVLANGNINGIDTAYFNPNIYSEEQNTNLRNDLNIGEQDFVFIFVGRLVGDKGINELVAAFNSMCTEYSNTKLLFVGEQEQKLDPLSEKTIALIKTNKSIISVGYQDDVRPYFSISDILVFPSYREGFPNVVMQAGAMGLPSIVTDINGCNEIIIEGANGTIIPPKNIELLEKKMVQLMIDSEYAKRLAKNARQMIIDRYKREFVWKALLDEYKSLEKRHVSKHS